MNLAILSEVGGFFYQPILIFHLEIYFSHEEEAIDQTCDLRNVDI